MVIVLVFAIHDPEESSDDPRSVLSPSGLPRLHCLSFWSHSGIGIFPMLADYAALNCAC